MDVNKYLRYLDRLDNDGLRQELEYVTLGIGEDIEPEMLHFVEVEVQARQIEED